MPPSAAGCSGAAENAQTVPSRFQGKPVKSQVRSPSPSSQQAAKAKRRATPSRCQSRVAARVSQNVRAETRARPAARPATAQGIAQPKRSVSNRQAIPTQYKPEVMWPVPTRQATRAALRALATADSIQRARQDDANRHGQRTPNKP